MRARPPRLVATSAVVAILLAACGRDSDGPSAPSASSPSATVAGTASASTTTTSTTTTSTTSTSTTVPARALTRVLFLGDSVAYDQAPGVLAALEASGITARSAAVPGAGIASEALPSQEWWLGMVAELRPEVVVYQLSLWDAIERDRIDAAYATFADALADSGVTLVLVGLPPTDPDLSGGLLDGVPAAARALAATRPDEVVYLDPAPAWGTTYSRDVDGDGVPDRKVDGTHVCPDGAAQFASWLLAELAARFAGVIPAPDDDWAGGEWTADPRYSDPDPAACTAA